jgi:hypothetical protein
MSRGRVRRPGHNYYSKSRTDRRFAGLVRLLEKEHDAQCSTQAHGVAAEAAQNG